MRRAAAHFLLTALVVSTPILLALVGMIAWDELITVPNHGDALALKIEWNEAKNKRDAAWIAEYDLRAEGRLDELTVKMAPFDAELADIDNRCRARFGHDAVLLQSRVTFLEWVGLRR